MVKRLPQTVLDMLASSGLTPEDARVMKVSYVDHTEAERLAGTLAAGRDAMKIPYFHPITKKPHKFNEKWPAFYRLRFLSSTKKSFGKDPIKYWQQSKSGMCAYYYPSVNWEEVFANPSQSLIITEGEKKAAKACCMDLPTIGIGGVDSFAVSDPKYDLLPDLELINWVQRTVYICHDSDFRNNRNIVRAIERLSERLWARGAIPKIACIPQGVNKEEKVGLDDYLLTHTTNQFICNVLNCAASGTTAEAMFELNKRLTYVKEQAAVYERSLNGKNVVSMSTRIFTDESEYAEKSIEEAIIDSSGDVVHKRTSAAAHWIRWPLRAKAQKIAYSPGEEPFEITPDGDFNVWPGWGCEAKEGDTRLFEELLEYLMGGDNAKHLHWFWQWLAYPIQHPGTKLYSCVVASGDQGVGKSFVSAIMHKIYGRNYGEIGQAELESSFNDWLCHKQFIAGDEVTGNNNHGLTENLKKIITQDVAYVNQKYTRPYMIKDCVNYYFTSNHVDAFFMEESDRRYFIIDAHKPPLPQSFYNKLDKWKDGDGPAALFYKLLHYDLKGFNPKARPPVTTGKVEMTELAKSDIALWISELKQEPDNVLRIGDAKLQSDLYTAISLLELYRQRGDSLVRVNGMARELKKAKVPQANGGNPVKTSDGKRQRFYIIRNEKKWTKATLEDTIKHIDNTQGRAGKDKY